MISKEILRKTLYFDIETAGIVDSFNDLEISNPRLAQLWKKRCKWLAQNSGEEAKYYTPSDFWKLKSSLHPEFSKVVCVTFGAYQDGVEKLMIKVNSLIGEEAEILNNTNKIFNNANAKGWKLAGHTIKNFDIPFIGKRMIINKINPSILIGALNRKPWESPYLDISDIFSFGGWGQTHSSLDLMSATLGYDSPKDEMDGSQVHQYFYEGRIDEIKKYCEKDVEALMKCFESFCFE